MKPRAQNSIKLVMLIMSFSLLTGCIGAVVGVAVDTTTAVVKAPFQIAGAAVGVAADTTGTVIAAPFRAVDAAFGGDHDHDGDHSTHDDHNHDSHEHHKEHEH